MLEKAREYVKRLERELDVEAAAVGGSVARGDFNVWSDVDVVVVSNALPSPGPERGAVLSSAAEPGVEPHGYTSAEFVAALASGDRLARETADAGEPIVGELPG